jgi:glycosyltransferase involved in cell wall biosynthesis
VTAAPGRTTIPLSSLRPDFSGGWPLGSRWTVPRSEGEHGTVEQPEGSVLAFRLRNSVGGRLRARLSLLPGDLRPSGAVRARVVVRGERHDELWSGLLGSVAGRATGGDVELDLPLPAGAETFDVLLCASRLKPLGKGGARLRWEDPVIEIAAPTEEHAAERAAAAAAPADGDGRREPTASPLFSILTPVHNPPPEVLEETLRSVSEQSFEDWELCLVDDGSTDSRVLEILERARRADARVHLRRHETAGGISAATNTALEQASGEYIALLDHDDVLAPDALETVAAAIRRQPDLDMAYSDEDVFDETGERVALFRKPSWSPDLMRSHMYTCHFGVYRRSLAEEVGGFRPEFDGSQDYDFVLRVSERSHRIVHIPEILYHWRSHVGSVAENLAAKPHAYAAARRAIAEHLERTGSGAEVHFDAKRCWYRVDYPADPDATTALILALPRVDEQLLAGLRRAAEAWAATTVPWELTVAGPSAALAECETALQGVVTRERLRLLPSEDGLGRTALFNRAAAATEAERLVFLEAPVEQLTTNWLPRLGSLAAQEGIGAVGAKTLAADGRVEHAGIVLRDGLPTPVQLAADQIEPGPMAVLYVRGNFAAVTGTVATSRRTLERLGGLDERFGALAIADFCLRAWGEGLRILSAPDAIVRRTERAAPVNDLGELAAFAAKWRIRLPDDPYFGPRAAAALTGVGQAN